MKRFVLIAIGVVLLVALLGCLAACDLGGGSQKKATVLTYVNKDGQTVNVNVQQTDSPQEVTDVLVALANQEAEDTAVRTLMATVRASLAATATANATAYHMDVDATLDAGVNVPTITADTTLTGLLNEAAPYLALSIKGNLPIDEDAEGNPDFASIIALDESAKVYYADSTVYGYLTLSNNLQAKLAEDGVEGLDVDIADYLDQYIKLDVSPLLGFVDYFLDFGEIVRSLPDLSGESSLDIAANLLGNEVDLSVETSDEQLRVALEKLVNKVSLCITRTDKNEITFRATITREFAMEVLDQFGAGFGEELSMLDIEGAKSVLADYNGTSYVAATFDAATMRFVGLDIDAKAIANCVLAAEVAKGSMASVTSLVLDNATLHIDLAYNAAIPTISEQDAASAKEFDSGASNIFHLNGGGKSLF